MFRFFVLELGGRRYVIYWYQPPSDWLDDRIFLSSEATGWVECLKNNN